jgi:hypothetical protein
MDSRVRRGRGRLLLHLVLLLLLLLLVMVVLRLDLDVAGVVHRYVAAIHGVVDKVLVVFRIRGHVSCRRRVHLRTRPANEGSISAGD